MVEMSDETPFKIQENIRRMRQDQGLSQRDLAELANVSLPTIIAIESGRNHNPTILTLFSLCLALEESLDDVLGVWTNENPTATHSRAFAPTGSGGD